MGLGLGDGFVEHLLEWSININKGGRFLSLHCFVVTMMLGDVVVTMNASK